MILRIEGNFGDIIEHKEYGIFPDFRAEYVTRPPDDSGLFLNFGPHNMFCKRKIIHRQICWEYHCDYKI